MRCFLSIQLELLGYEEVNKSVKISTLVLATDRQAGRQAGRQADKTPKTASEYFLHKETERLKEGFGAETGVVPNIRTASQPAAS